MAGGYDAPSAKLAETLLWQVWVPAQTWLMCLLHAMSGQLLTVSHKHAFDGNTRHQMINSSHPRGPIAEENILKALDRNLETRVWMVWVN